MTHPLSSNSSTELNTNTNIRIQMDENEPIPNTTRNKIYEKNGKKWYSEPKNLKKTCCMEYVK